MESEIENKKVNNLQKGSGGLPEIGESRPPPTQRPPSHCVVTRSVVSEEVDDESGKKSFRKQMCFRHGKCFERFPPPSQLLETSLIHYIP